jgi:hypothetical protein
VALHLKGSRKFLGWKAVPSGAFDEGGHGHGALACGVERVDPMRTVQRTVVAHAEVPGRRRGLWPRFASLQMAHRREHLRV